MGKFREGTSYEIINDLNKFNKYLSKYGLKAKIKDYGVEEIGTDKMHKVAIQIE